MELSTEQKRRFAEDGYVYLPGVVPRNLVDAALRAINASLGERGIPPDDLPVLRSRSYCPELQHDAAITGLLNASGLLELAESAIGRDQLLAVAAGQIALRFPTMGRASEPRPHLDGMHTATNGVPEGRLSSFTGLAGVMLSDVTGDGQGNLVVWPGSHRLNGEYFREHQPESLLAGMPRVGLPAPRQVTGHAGDAVLCHYLLSHGVATNVSANIRYAVYFRLNRVNHDARQREAMMDPWHEWDGIRPLAAV